MTAAVPAQPTDDLAVLLEAQSQALEQAKETAQRQQDPRTAALWATAIKEMDQAMARLKAAAKTPAALSEALAAEQAAYQALLKVQEHEYQVSRRNRNQRGGGSGEQQMQRQLDEMDLTASEDRYEQRRQAQSPQTSQRREQLQVMNRLQELARRQQDLNDRMKELQTALQEAPTEQQREEIRRRLKRLQEEEQEMVASLDELRQRMDRPENQSNMEKERQQLDQTRNDVQRAAEAAGEGAPSRALAAGARAQSQLQQMRDQMRKENSSQFAEDLREMRAQARESARRQEELVQQLSTQAGNDSKTLSESAQQREMQQQLARQKERITNLVERATQISQQADESEPLLSRQLYDTVRKFTQDSSKNEKEIEQQLLSRGLATRSLLDELQSSEADSAKLLELTSEMLRQGFLPQASETAQRSRAGIEDLKRGVEHAAESVIGDDAEALRLAQQELNQLTDQLGQEIARAQSSTAQTNRPAATSRETGAPNQSPGGTNGAGSQASEPDAAASAASGRQTASTRAGQPNGGDSQSDAARPGGQQSGQRQGGSNNTEREGQTAQNRQGGRGLQDDPGRGARTAGGRREAGGSADQNAGGGDEFGGNWNRLLDAGAWRQTGPLTGEDFTPWSDRLRDVEEMIEQPDLRNQVASARERARLIRQEFKRNLKKPDWAVVRLQVMNPLAEVQNRIADELARRDSREALVPLDRDPVPNRYTDLVRHYYEDLGKQK